MDVRLKCSIDPWYLESIVISIELKHALAIAIDVRNEGSEEEEENSEEPYL